MFSEAQTSKQEKASPQQSSQQAHAPALGTLPDQTHQGTAIQHARRSPILLTPSTVVQLQRTIGNQAVSRLLGDQLKNGDREQLNLRQSTQTSLQRTQTSPRGPQGAARGRPPGVQQPSQQKRKISTIEDFIQFVETVERYYPSNRPAEIVGEIRQIWFSDGNWDLMVAGEGAKGMSGDGRMVPVDIESPPSKIAEMFDMKDLNPKGGKKIETPLGMVDIGHVMAGIDATLNGFPSAYPGSLMEAPKAAPVYNTLRVASGGKVADFATWAGDLGQAYAEYLVDRWLRRNRSNLSDFVRQKASHAALLGDIHGYIAKPVSNNIAAKRSTRGSDRVSDILRNFYLVNKRKAGVDQGYKAHFARTSGKPEAQIGGLIYDRALRFARIWYAKTAFENKGLLLGPLESRSLQPRVIIERLQEDFDRKHRLNEAKAEDVNKLLHICQRFQNMLNGRMP